MGLYRSISYFLASVLWAYISFTNIVQGRQCPDAVNRAGNGGTSPLNPIVWRNQPQIHVVNWIPDNLCNNVQECYGTDQVDEKSDHFPQLCPLYVQHGDPIYFVSGATEKDFLNPIAVSQNDFSNCSLITYPYYWKVTTFPKRHSLKVPTKFLFPGDHHFVQVPFLGSPGCEAGFRLRVTVRTQDCTVPSYPNNPCFGNGYCVFIDKNSPAGASQNETCEEKEDDGDRSDPLSRQGLQMFKCKCRVPYKGRYCEDYDACWNHQCQNGGRCHDLRKGINNREYTCTCPLNYIGKHCEFVKSCFEGLCQNGGQCFYDTSKPNHFQCVCQPAFSGNRCEISTGPGPGQQQLTVLTDNLIREQEERDKALRDQDKMVKTIDQMGGENLTRLSYPRIIIAPFLIGGRPGTTPPPSCNAIVDPKAIDCGVCGCPNGGICIREKPTGPNSCFCPPGVSGPSCKSLAGICTYAQPCLNGGTCLERMIAAANGAAASAQSEQDDSDSLMFPAPGENPAPQPTISWSALTATPVIPVGDGTNAQAQLTPSNNGESNANQPYICLCPTGFFGFTCQSNKDEYCPPTDGSGLEGAAAPLAPLEGGTTAPGVTCLNGGSPVGNTCVCPRKWDGPRCENIATVMIIPDTRPPPMDQTTGPRSGTGVGGVVLLPGARGSDQLVTSTVSPQVEATQPIATTTVMGQAQEQACMEDRPCQNNGVCLRPEGQQPKCLCTIGFGGRFCENGITLDNPLFTGHSFVRVRQPTKWDKGDKLMFDVDAIPQTGSGTVFKVVNGGMNPPNTNVTFQLYLMDGQLHYDIVHVPSGTVIAHVTSTNPNIVGNVNKVQIENQFKPGTNQLESIVFTLDNDRNKTRDVFTVTNNTLNPSNIEIVMSPESDIYIGAPSGQSVLIGVNGQPGEDASGTGNTDTGGNFKGTIQNFKINGIPIDIATPGQEGYGIINATPGSCNNLCRNGGTCKTEGWLATCQCPEGFQGSLCESRSCEHCQNGGLCIDLRGNDNFACLCQFGWTGVRCEQKMDIEVRDTYKFNGMKFGYPSFVNFYPVDTLSQSSGFDMKFKFMIDDPNSPAWRNSLLVFAGQNTAQSSQPSFLVVGLQAGHVVYRFDASGASKTDPQQQLQQPQQSDQAGQSQTMRELITSQPLDQSIPAHEVRFGRKNGDSWLYVDGQEGVFDKIPANVANDPLDIWNGLYFGGYKTFLMLWLPHGASVFRNGFKGCIYDINIKPPGENENYQPILQSGAKLSNSLNVLPCFKEAMCKGDSCQNGGQCVELGANFHCRCKSQQFTGPLCENVDPNFITTTPISNEIGGGGVIIPGPGGITIAPTMGDEDVASAVEAAGSRRSQCELIIDNSLSEAFSVNIRFAGTPETDQIVIVLNIMAENKSLYKLTFILDFRPLINIKKGDSVAIKDDVFVLPLNNSMTIRNFTLSKIKSKLTINVNDVVHDLKVNITNHEILHSLSLGLGNLNHNVTQLIANKNFCYKTAELIIQNAVINIEDYFNCNMIEKCKE